MFVRLLERVEADKWGTVLVDDETTERREFLRAIDAVKKRTQRARKFSGLTPDLPDHRPGDEHRSQDDRDAVAKAADRGAQPAAAAHPGPDRRRLDGPRDRDRTGHDRRARQRREVQGRQEAAALSRDELDDPTAGLTHGRRAQAGGRVRFCVGEMSAEH